MRGADPGVVLGLHRSRHDRHLLETALTLGVRHLDTSYNYLGFSSHETLARTAGDLLPEFAVSTKVGFFPAGGRAEHSLDPARLTDALKRSVDDLGTQPAVVFLHNPERTAADLPPEEAEMALASACRALDDATRAGLCRSWGIATWNPRPLVDAVQGVGSSGPVPAVLMVRSGLLVGPDDLDASLRLVKQYGLGTGACWGMSPFGGLKRNAAAEAFPVERLVLPVGAPATPRQAAFRLSYELPKVSHVAVGTDDPDHLGELVDATSLAVDQDAVSVYQRLLLSRRKRQPSSSPTSASASRRAGSYNGSV